MVAMFALAALLACCMAGCKNGPTGCVTDLDCRDPRICVAGQCQYPPDFAMPAVSADDFAVAGAAPADLAVPSSRGDAACTVRGTPVDSGFPAGYVVSYNVMPPCDAHATCMQCLPGPTGSSACKWCGNPGGGGNCVSTTTSCATGQVELANHYNGYCPEYCDQMDGTSCGACVNQPSPYNGTCSWCPETMDCFNERASQVGLQPAAYCASTKAGPFGIACSDVPPYCGP